MEDKDTEVVGFAAYVKGRWYLQGDHVDRIVAHEKAELRNGSCSGSVRERTIAIEGPQIERLFAQKAFVDESALDRLGVFFGHALSANDLVPCRAHFVGHVENDCLRLCLFEEKAGVLRKHVFRIGEPALIANCHREVAPILRDLGRWGQVIGGRQLPFALFGN